MSLLRISVVWVQLLNQLVVRYGIQSITLIPRRESASTSVLIVVGYDTQLLKYWGQYLISIIKGLFLLSSTQYSSTKFTIIGYQRLILKQVSNQVNSSITGGNSVVKSVWILVIKNSHQSSFMNDSWMKNHVEEVSSTMLVKLS